MAHSWNPYLHNFSSLPSNHGTPDSEGRHPHPSDDFISHGGFSSASLSHGASTANTNYCFSNSIGNSNSNWSSEIGNSQRHFKEMAWQPDGKQKAYLPRWDNRVSNFEANVLETTGHCSAAPQLGLKHDSVVPKGSQYFENYLNVQASSDEVGEPRSSCEFTTRTSEHHPQIGGTATYHSQWVQSHTENANMSTDRAYSNMWPNVTVENASTCVQDKSKSFEHHGIPFANSNTYADSEIQRTGNFDRTSTQTFVNICQNVNLSENYNGIDAQTMMDANITSETNKDDNLDSAHRAFSDEQAANRPTSDSFQNERDDKDDGPSQSSSRSSVTNDLMNSDASLTDASESSNDSQPSFQANAVNADEEKVVETADCSSYSHLIPTASDANHSDSCLSPESHRDSLIETMGEEQAASSKKVVTFSTSSTSDPSSVIAVDIKDGDVLTESNAACIDGCSLSIDNKTSKSGLLDSATNTVIDNKTNESDPFDSAANVTVNNTNENDKFNSAASVIVDNKANESDPFDSTANVIHNREQCDHDIKTLEIERPCSEEKMPDSDYIGACSDVVNDGGDHAIDNNKTMVVFDSEPRLAEDCLNKRQEKESTTTCTTPNVTCDEKTDEKSIEDEQNAFPNIDTMDKEPQIPNISEEKSSHEKKIKQESPENIPISSDPTLSMKQVQNYVEKISCLESEISDDKISACESSKPKPDEEHLVWDYFGKPLSPSTSEMDGRPETPEMKPSSAMLKRLQPIVLIKTSDLVHLISDKYICAQCMHITSSVDELIEHHSLQHPAHAFQLCTSCGVYLVHQDQPMKHVCGQESIIVSSKKGKKKRRQKQYCNKCGIRFLRWNAFISHMRIHTGVTPYRCENCKLYFAQQSTLTRHKKIVGRCRGSLSTPKCAPRKSHNHSVKSVFKCYVKLYDITKTPFCKFCGKCFKSRVKVNKHFHNVHKKQVTIPNQSEDTSETTEKEKKIYKCLFCPMTFSHYLNRDRHLKDCLKECVFGQKNRVNGRYKCPLCLGSFTLTSNRHRHIYTFCLRNFLSFLRKNTSKPIKFPRYSKQMKTVINKLKAEEEQLNNQSSVNVTHNAKHKVFEVTGRRFKFRHSVDKTLSSETNEIQKNDIDSLKCKYCDKSFGSSQALKMHELTHQGERPFYCSQCGKGFKSHFVLTHHKITHQRRIQCTVCRKILPTIGELIQHRTSHINRGMLQCPDCPRQFTFPVYLVRHLRYHLKTQNKLIQLDETDTPSLPPSTHNQCQLCSEVFDGTNLLRKHYLTHIPKSSSPQCPFCKRKFTNRRYLVRHVARHVGGKRLSKEINFISQSETSETKTKGSFVCRYCSRTFMNQGHLMKHYRGHKNKTLLQCKTCTFYYGVSKLSKHKKMCKIETTGSTSQTTNQPSVHKVPSEETKYRCQHCPQSFKYPSLYYRHLSTHKGVEVHACILCGQSFPSLALCSQHEASCEGLYKCEESIVSKKAKMLTKSGTSELKCKFCHKKFAKSRNLRHHILTHNEVKPYRCKACDSCFSRYDHLKVHFGRCIGKEKLQLTPQICIPKISLDQVGTGWQKELTHGKVVKKQTLECKICVRKFTTRSKLKWHNSMFHSVKRFKCMQCSSFFSHEKSLRNHIRHRRCRLTNIVKSKTLLQKTQPTKTFSSEKQNVLLARILPTSTEQNANKIKCNFCHRAFRTSAHLKVHSSLHCEKAFSCDCGKTFFKKPNLLRHMTTCIRKQNQSSHHGFSCAYCSSRFLLFSQLQEHFLNAHKLETMDEPVETAPLQQHLSNIQQFKENQFVAEPSQISKLNRAFEKKSPAVSQSRECPYPCKICNRGFWNKTLRRNHFRKCCRNVSNTTEPLEEEDVPLRANIDMVLTDSGAENSPEEIEDMEQQNKSSQEKKPSVYQCSECDKSFTDGLLLISHLEAHGREEQEKRLNKCSKCGRTFLNQVRLEKHMKVHESVLFNCKDCSTELPSKSELEIHRKKCHNPSNPYLCRLCHHRFRTRTSFSDHCVKKHPDNIFSCHICNRNYTLRTSLIRHNKKHHGQEQKEGAQKSLSTQSSSESEASAPTAAADDEEDGDEEADDGDGDDDVVDDDHDSDSDSDSDSADSDSAPYFPCHVCGKTFTTSESLEDHQRCHLGEKPYECAQCGQCFFQAGQLQQHERKHKSEFQCRICGRGFLSLFALRKHKHTSGKKRPFRCKKCPLYFPTFVLLSEHMLIHREESFPCDICNRVFPSKSSRAEHRKIHLPKSSANGLLNQPAVKADNKPTSSSMAATSEFKYRCGVCCVRFRNPEELSEHGCLAGIERQYSCLDCDKHFLHSSHLKKHLSTHKQPSSQSKYSCNQCNNSYSTPQDFLNHLRNHDETIHSGQGFICPICHQCFTNPAELVFHFPNHPSGTFQCKICNKTFSTATQLKEHEVCHNKETKCEKCGQTIMGTNHECSARHVELMNIVSSFADDDEIDVTGEDLCFCPFCPMRFSSRSNLLEHQNREHPNEKTFTCEICARTYAKQKYLDKHMKKHHQNDTAQSKSQIKFQCAQCHSEFTTAKDLSIHLKLHAAENEVGEYRCDMCYKSFGQLHLLRRHQESHVGQVVYECTECDKAFAFPHLLEEHQKSHV